LDAISEWAPAQKYAKAGLRGSKRFAEISLALSRVVIKGLPAIIRILSAFSGKPRGTGDRILNDFRRLPIV
jgi:hypothetical protein